MDTGDKVKIVKGEDKGKAGDIVGVIPISEVVNLENDPTALDHAKLIRHFLIEDENGEQFLATEDQLELL